MAITAETRTNIIELTVGMVNAAPGADILSELADAVGAGLSLSDLAIAIANNPAFKVLYPSFLTNEEFATNFLTQLIGSEVDQEFLDGSVAVMVADLNAGTHRGAAMYNAITTLSAIEETDADYGAAAAALHNKTEVAEYYTVTLQESSESLDELIAVVSSVDSTDASVTAAKAAADGSDNQGDTLTFTTGQDALNGTGGNDTFLAIVDTGTPANTTYSLGDVIDGKAGIDTLNITTDGLATNVATATVSNVEKLEVTSTNAGGDHTASLNNVAFDSATFSGIKGVDGGIDTFAVSNVLKGTKVVLKGIADIGTTISFSDTGTGTDAATVEVAGSTDDATKADTENNLTIANIDTLTLNLTTGANDIDVLTATDAETVTVNVSGGNAAIEGASDIDNATVLNINAEKNLTATAGLALADSAAITVTGAGAVNLGTLDDNGALKGVTLDGSAMTGKLTAIGGGHTVSITGGAAGDSLTSGSASTIINAGAGDDRVSIVAFDYGTGTGTVTGGDGTDTLSLSASDNLDAATLAKVTGFEVLSIAGANGGDGAGGGASSYDVSSKGFTAVVADADLASASTVTGITTESVSITASLTSALTLALKSAAGAADSLSLSIGGAADVTAAQVITAGIETLTLNSSNGKTGNTISSLATDATKLVISGTQKITITDFLEDTAAAVNTDTVTIDASAAAKGLVMGDFVSGLGVSILGSEVADTLLVGDVVGDGSGAATGSTVNANGGGDIITISKAGALDTLIVNAGDSVIGYVDVNKDSAFTTAADTELYDIVTGFTTAEDTLDLGSFGFTGTKASALAGPALTEANAVKLVDGTTASITGFFIDTGVQRGAAVVSGDYSDLGGTATDTLVFIDSNGDGNLTNADDMILLAGTASIGLADIGF